MQASRLLQQDVLILVGRQLASALDDEALDHVLMHEQAHVDRWDDWTQLLQAVVRPVAGLHPAVWWLSRRIDVASFKELAGVTRKNAIPLLEFLDAERSTRRVGNEREILL